MLPPPCPLLLAGEVGWGLPCAPKVRRRPEFEGMARNIRLSRRHATSIQPHSLEDSLEATHGSNTHPVSRRRRSHQRRHTMGGCCRKEFPLRRQLLYSVATTGVYCRPSCPSRPARQVNVTPTLPLPRLRRRVGWGSHRSGSRRLPTMQPLQAGREIVR